MEIATAFGLPGVGAFGFGDRGVNSDEPRTARKMREQEGGQGGGVAKEGEGGRVEEDQREEKEDEEKEEK